MVAEEIQVQLQAALRERLPEALFEQWFSGIEVVACSGTQLELGVKNRFFKNWIESRYLDTLSQAAESCLGKPVAVTVSVSARLYASFRDAQEKALEEANSLTAQPETDAAEFNAPEMPRSPRRDSFSGMRLNPDFTFDSFVTGGSNRLSQAVALRAVEAPEDFDRLYFCGEHGVGKTHLLQAICRETLIRNPDAKVVYVTCERFVADFVAAHAKGDLAGFRANYRDCDVLAVDQVQVLGQGSKTATQSELLGILDDMSARGKQAVFAATLSPAELEGVDARLRDRLGAGFVDRLLLPDENVRRKLIVRKLAEKGVRLPDDALEMIARETTGNVRRLEGAVNRLAALIALGGMPANLSCLRMALEVSTPAGKRTALTLPDIVDAVAGEFGLATDMVLGRGRTATARRARTVAVILCRKLLGTSYAEIGERFGARSHATVISMVKKAAPEWFSTGLESRPVERILFRLGVGVKPEELLERQGGLFG